MNRPNSLWPDPSHLGPATDLYQLTMMAGFSASGIDETPATFEMFVRRLPKGRSYLIFAGLEQAIADLQNLRFSDEQIDRIQRLPVLQTIPRTWFDSLRQFEFRGDVWSVPEGTVVFAGEPLLRVTAPLVQAQLAETFLLSSLGYPTLVASKAARVMEAAKGRTLFDFGARRGHGPLAGYINARSSYIAGFDGTSHVDAAIQLGVPCLGTMAHSWIQAFGAEERAFREFSRSYPGSTLLVDTYDCLEGVRTAATIEPPIGMIRIDSGDLNTLARESRAILDRSQREATKILGSGDLDEWKIQELVEQGAPFDGFGVGTELITSRDAPALSLVYKLVEIAGEGRMKLSSGKKSYPLAKQVFRQLDETGQFVSDLVTRADESANGIPLLRPYLVAGKVVDDYPSLSEIRARAASQRASLPAELRRIDSQSSYPIEYSDALQDEARRLGVIESK